MRTDTFRIHTGNRPAVRTELLKWVLSGGTKLPGLVRRRQAEGALFATGKYK